MKLHRSVGILAACLTVTTLPAHAAEPRSGVYLSFDAGKSTVSSQVYEESGDPSFGLALGYAFNPNLAVEAFWRGLSFRVFDGLVGDTNHYPADHAGVAVIGSLPLGERVRLYGRLGVGRTSMESDSASKSDYRVTDPSVGVGVAYDFAPRWSVRLSTTRFTDTKVTTTLLGIDFRF